MGLLSSNVNTRSHSNYEEDFKEYISGMRGAYSELSQVVEQHGNLVYDLDFTHRANLIDYLELLEVTLIKMLRQNGCFRANIYQELFDLYIKIASLAVQADRHEFLVITSVKVQILADFVLKNTK